MNVTTALRITFGLFAILFSLARPAQASCDAILGASVRDYVRIKTSSETYAQQLSNGCSAYQRYESNKTTDNLAALTEYFYLSNDFSSNQAESIAQAACHYTSNVNDAAAANSTFLNTVNPLAINAWSQCNALRAVFDPSITFPDDGRRTVVVSFRYQGHDTSRISSVTADGPVACNGDLGPVTAQTAVFHPVALHPNETLTETCVRPISTDRTKAYSSSDGYMYALPVDVVFSTPDGPVTAALQALPVTPESSSSNIPIGGIIDWFTTAAQPSPPAGFMICDGSAIVVGPLRGQSTPNLVHRFTMGVKSIADGYYAKPQDPATVSHDPTTGIPAASWAVSTSPNTGGTNNGNQESLRFQAGNCNGDNTLCASPQGHVHSASIEDPPFVGLLKIIRIQ